MKASSWTLFGLGMNLVGICLLFVFGAPIFARTHGITLLAAEGANYGVIGIESVYHWLSWIGFVLTVAGTVAQMIAARNR